jgi:hypothetical protein
MDILAYRDPEQHLGECTLGLLSDDLLDQLDRPLWVGGRSWGLRAHRLPGHARSPAIQGSL